MHPFRPIYLPLRLTAITNWRIGLRTYCVCGALTHWRFGLHTYGLSEIAAIRKKHHGNETLHDRLVRKGASIFNRIFEPQNPKLETKKFGQCFFW